MGTYGGYIPNLHPLVQNHPTEESDAMTIQLHYEAPGGNITLLWTERADTKQQ